MDKKKLFCIFCLQSFNVTQAYLKAYGGSKKVAGAKISELAKIFGFEGNLNDSDLPTIFIDNLGGKNES